MSRFVDGRQSLRSSMPRAPSRREPNGFRSSTLDGARASDGSRRDARENAMLFVVPPARTAASSSLTAVEAIEKELRCSSSCATSPCRRGILAIESFSLSAGYKLLARPMRRDERAHLATPPRYLERLHYAPLLTPARRPTRRRHPSPPDPAPHPDEAPVHIIHLPPDTVPRHHDRQSRARGLTRQGVASEDHSSAPEILRRRAWTTCESSAEERRTGKHFVAAHERRSPSLRSSGLPRAPKSLWKHRRDPRERTLSSSPTSVPTVFHRQLRCSCCCPCRSASGLVAVACFTSCMERSAWPGASRLSAFICGCCLLFALSAFICG